MSSSEVEYINTTISVPKHRLAEFHEMFGRWLGSSLDRPSETRDDSTTGGKTPWVEGDTKTAVRFYEGVSPKAALILDFWMDLPTGQWVTGEDTAQFAGLNGAYGVAGSLSSVGKAAARLQRALPFEYKPGAPGTSGAYRMSELVAKLFREARAQLQSQATSTAARKDES